MNSAKMVHSSFRNLITRVFSRLRMAIAPFAEVIHELPVKGQILDVGCGHGLLAHLIAETYPKTRVTGVDIDAYRIATAQASTQGNPRLTFAVCDVIRDPLPTKSYDAIVCFDLLHHIPPAAQEAVVTSCVKLLKPEGTLIIKEINTTPRWKYLWNLFHDTIVTKGDHIYCRSHTQWQQLVKKLGVSITQTTFPANGFFYPHVLIVAKKGPR